MQTLERSAEGGGQIVGRAHWRLGDDLEIEAHGLSSRGPVRPTNDDSLLVADVDPSDRRGTTSTCLPLLGVADGVSGQHGGAKASRLVVRTAIHDAGRRGRAGEWAARRDPASVEASLAGVFHACQGALARCGASDPTLARMATTFTAGLIRDRLLHVAHVGDSRCYLGRGDTLRPLTTDHTMARSLEASGARPLPDTSRLHHVLANVLAAHHQAVEVETLTIPLEPEDRLLFCSDGLSNALCDDAIATVVADAPSTGAAARRLLQRAVDMDGADNVTIVVAHVRSRGA